MLGLVAYHAAGEPPLRVVGGVRFRAAYVTPGGSLRARLSARAAARALERGGVRYAVFPSGYPYCETFAHRGIVPPPLAPLYRATAAAIVRRYMAQQGVEARDATIALAASSVTPELRRAAETLCAEARYIALAIPRGGGELARSLRRGHGVAARLVAPGEPLQADLTVDFDGCATTDGALRLDGTLRVVYDSGLPNGLLAALWQAGALDAGALAVEAVALPDGVG